jgi:hypothetical protein
LSKDKWQVLPREVLAKLDYGVMPKHLSYYYESTKNNGRYRMTINRKFPLFPEDRDFTSGKNFDTYDVTKLPEKYEEAKFYLDECVLLSAVDPKEYGITYELSDKGKQLSEEYLDIVNIAKKYLN